VPESVGRIVSSVLLTVRIGSARAAWQASDFGEGREGFLSNTLYVSWEDTYNV
jgi:hypothetical protein